MVWYNPLSWFKERGSKEGEMELYCANPQCRKPLREGERVAYETQTSELTRSGDCQNLLFAWRAFNSGEANLGEFEIVSYERAVKLAREGKVNSRSLTRKNISDKI